MRDEHMQKPFDSTELIEGFKHLKKFHSFTSDMIRLRDKGPPMI